MTSLLFYSMKNCPVVHFSSPVNIRKQQSSQSFSLASLWPNYKGNIIRHMYIYIYPSLIFFPHFISLKVLSQFSISFLSCYMYWIGKNIHSDFPIKYYGIAQMNLLANPIFKTKTVFSEKTHLYFKTYHLWSEGFNLLWSVSYSWCGIYFY